jgi:molybdate transport system substrate-binding protein
VLRRLGLHDRLAHRFATFPSGAVAMRELAASSDDVPIGCTQVTEILYTDGVRLAGVLPSEFELATGYTAAVAARSADPSGRGAWWRCCRPRGRALCAGLAGSNSEATLPSKN